MTSCYDVVIVGAGFAGSACARVLAEAGRRVLIVERRLHIGGNAYDEFDEHGILIHKYGPHLFHTNSERVFQWLSRFTDWLPYEHRVLASVDGQLLPIPINQTTINSLYNLNLDSDGVENFLESVRVPCANVRTSEDVVLSSVGHDLCEKFFRGYTRKQWGLDLRDLSAGVAARIPTRVNCDDRYFTDRFQAMPKAGYAAMFSRIIDHPNIEIRLGCDYFNSRREISAGHIIFTGPVDAFFDYKFGRLPYRSLHFEHQHLPDIDWYQRVGTINYPNEHSYTRVTEFKHATGQRCKGTSIVREYPQEAGEPYYPIPRPENELLYQRYRQLAEETPAVTFVGRLAQYRYYNMDQVVAAALKVGDNLIGNMNE